MMRGQKGITLVALVITIIVMLILAGVTISIAINGGLFGQAQNSVSETKVASAKEDVQLAKSDAVAAYYASKTGENPIPLDEVGVWTVIANDLNNSWGDGSVEIPTATPWSKTVSKDGYSATITVTIDQTKGTIIVDVTTTP